MGTRTQKIVDQIKTTSEAREAIALLLTRFGSNAATGRLVEDARYSHQSVEESASRVAGNFLNSLVVRKPGGRVVEY